MNGVSADEIRAFILKQVAERLTARGLAVQALPDSFDLYAEGIIDSMGLLEVINSIEEQFGFSVDLEGLSPDEVTVVGPLSRYIASKAAVRM